MQTSTIDKSFTMQRRVNGLKWGLCVCVCVCLQNMQGVSCSLTYTITQELPSLQDVLKDILDFVRNIMHVCDCTEDNLQSKYGTRISNQKLLKQLQQSGMELLVAVTDWPVFVKCPENRHKPDSIQTMLKTIVKKLTLPNESLRQVCTNLHLG